MNNNRFPNAKYQFSTLQIAKLRGRTVDTVAPKFTQLSTRNLSLCQAPWVANWKRLPTAATAFHFPIFPPFSPTPPQFSAEKCPPTDIAIAGQIINIKIVCGSGTFSPAFPNPPKNRNNRLGWGLQRCVYAIKFMLMQNTLDCRIFVEKTANECQIAMRLACGWWLICVLFFEIYFSSQYISYFPAFHFYYFPVATFPQMLFGPAAAVCIQRMDVVLKCGGCPHS